MKIAIFSDVHANIQALEAVWDEIQQQDPDQVYCLGDLVGYGANPNEAIEFIRKNEIPTIMGNYDNGVGLELDSCGCKYSNSRLERLGELSIWWSRGHTSQANKDFLQELPREIRLKENVLLVHGSPRSLHEYLPEERPTVTFERIAKVAECDIMLFGHTHIPYEKRVAGTLFVNAGSVGRPKDGDPRAGYVILDSGEVEFRRVAYDAEAAAQAVRASDLPDYYADELLAGRELESVP
ncbi:MAG: metallophosphoesterase family protein [Anaerolineales bacterium]